MKQLLILILLAVSIATSAQTSTTNSSFTFKINNKQYSATEEVLDNLFGNAFSELKIWRVAKEGDFPLWLESFQKWKKTVSKDVVLSWNVYGDRIGNVQMSGWSLSNEERGLAENGGKATGNPNKKKNLAHRIAYINALMTKYLTNHLTGTDLK